MKNKLRIILLYIILAALALSFVAAHGSTRRYTITFDSNEGSECAPITISGKHGILLPTPVRDGYTFEGWYFDNEKWNDRLTSTTFSNKRPKGDLTVYAKWTFTGYRIIFVSNGGSEVEDITLDKDQTISAQPFTEREGYRFLGWCVDQTLSVLYELGTPVNKSMTLYAKWVANDNKQHYTVTFETNGGDVIAPIQVLEGQAISVPSPLRVGHDFVGWYVDNEFKLAYPAGNLVVTNITLYAKWEVNPDVMKVTFNSEGGSSVQPVYTIKGEIITAPQPTRNGYQFMGWYTDIQKTQLFNFNNGIYTSLNLYAKWQEISAEMKYYSVSYYSDGELYEKLELIENSFVSNKNLTKDGYSFGGWFSDEEYTAPFDFTAPLTSNVILYAKWIEISNNSENGFVFVLSNNGSSYLITDYSANETDIVIPEQFNSKSVTGIYEYAFRGKNITSVTFSANLIQIGVGAFENCSMLAEIIIPETIEFIGRGAFNNCTSLETVTILGNPVMQGYIFVNCVRLVNVNLDDRITSLPDHMFNNCILLEQIILPADCEVIGKSAFAECRTLNSVVLNDNLHTISNEAFYNCSSLTDIDLKNVTTINSRAFTKSGITDLVLTDSVITVNEAAFSDCHKLRTVYFGAGLTNILMPFAFENTNNINSYQVSPQNAYFKNIGNNLYSKDGTRLITYASGQADNSFTVPDGVTTIGMIAFLLVNDLNTVIISKDVASIEENAFVFLHNFSSFEVNEDNQHYSVIDGVLYDKTATKLIRYPQNKAAVHFIMPNSVTHMSAYSFMDAVFLQEITLSDNLQQISHSAFFNATNLSKVNYSVSAPISEIQSNAFENCISLEQFQIPQATTILGSEVFAGSGIINIVIPTNITSIGSNVFKSCYNLTNVRIGTSSLTEIDSGFFSNCDSLSEIHILNDTHVIIFAENSVSSSPKLYVPSSRLSQYITLVNAAMFSAILSLP